MSILNGLGAGLTSFGADLGKDAEAEDARRASLINAAPPAAVAAATPVAPPPNPLAGPRVAATDTDTHGNKLDPATLARAHDVYQGLMARGMDPATAIGFTANAVQESRADPGTGAGDMGASHQLMQWRGPRWDAFTAKYGQSASVDDALDHIMAELKGPEAGAWAKIQATDADPAAKAGAVSAFYERPKDTQAEIARRGYIANALAGHFAQLASNGTGAP